MPPVSPPSQPIPRPVVAPGPPVVPGHGRIGSAGMGATCRKPGLKCHDYQYGVKLGTCVQAASTSSPAGSHESPEKPVHGRPTPIPWPTYSTEPGRGSDEGGGEDDGQSPLLLAFLWGSALLAVGGVTAAAMSLHKTYTETQTRGVMASENRRGLAMFEDQPSASDDLWDGAYQAVLDGSSPNGEQDEESQDPNQWSTRFTRPSAPAGEREARNNSPKRGGGRSSSTERRRA